MTFSILESRMTAFEKLRFIAAKLRLAAILSSALLLACSYSRPKPFPIHKAEMPACPGGVWVCDSRAGKTCICLSNEDFGRWKKKNGL